MTIEPIQADDAGEYRCRVDFRWARTLNNIMKLQVVVPPKDVLILDENLQPLYRLIGPYDEDSMLRLKCLAKGGRPPPSVTWWRELHLLDKIHENENEEEVVNELVIRRLARTDLNAELICQVWNSNLTSSIIATVFLDLNYKPLVDVFLHGGRTSQAVHEDDDAYLDCYVKANPTVNEINWYFQESELKSNSKDAIIINNQSIILKNVSRKQSGFYRCSARNSEGEGKSKSIELEIKCPPEPVINCTWANETSYFLLVECKSGYDGGLQQLFQMEVYDVDKKHLQINLTSHSKPVFHVSGLTPGASLILVVYAINAKGRSSAVEMNVETSVSTERQFRNSPSSPLKPLLGVLFAGLAILTFIIFLVFRLKRKRKEKDAHGEEHVKKER
ncbi:lachesin-like [Limulus polyphemus]|uniref:Lachesin-like n=1 Tax=Limulus polyphemus TaxID=6850 RepID=A0ABM1B1K8_LIMPO|nr:lachesin-like [Limulus polyphemus]